jgi:hypothetical protein
LTSLVSAGTGVEITPAAAAKRMAMDFFMLRPFVYGTGPRP